MTKQEAKEKLIEEINEIGRKIMKNTTWSLGSLGPIHEIAFNAGARWILERMGKCETCIYSKGNTCDPMSFICRNCDKCNWQPKEELTK